MATSTPIPAIRTSDEFLVRTETPAPGPFRSVAASRFSWRAFGRLLGVIVAMPLLADVSSIRDLIRTGRLEEAVAECDREIQAAPRRFALFTMKRLALHAAGNEGSALSAFQRALVINPACACTIKRWSSVWMSSALEFKRHRLRPGSRPCLVCSWCAAVRRAKARSSFRRLSSSHQTPGWGGLGWPPH